MLLTITTTHRPATDLGYLLHKNPARFQSFDLSFGKAHVFYPRRRRPLHGLPAARRGPGGDGPGQGRRFAELALAQYVNDRPYVASSFMSVAIAQVFGSALEGRCKDRPELATTPIPLVGHGSTCCRCRGGEKFLPAVFEPLGYEVECVRYPLDERFPSGATSPYFSVTLAKTTTLSELLTHLYVLIPVFDNHKHYFVGDDEMEKLLKQGRGLAGGASREGGDHPPLLEDPPSLVRQALARLAEQESSRRTTAEKTGSPQRRPRSRWRSRSA